MVYIIKESLSKEENLRLAKEYADKAKELLTKFDELLNEAHKEFPGGTFGLSKAQLIKHKSPKETYERLQASSRSHSSTIDAYIRKERMEREKEAKLKNEEIAKQRELEQANLLNEAIAYCLENGRKFGENLTAESAIRIANDIAFEKERERREAEIGDGYIDFNGQNCDDPCNGWNPKEHRCDCGNRRVDWTNDYSNFKDMTIYAEAY
jgi:hypothetical protein